MYIKKNHLYDGTQRAGLPEGRVLQVTKMEHVNGMGMTASGMVYHLEDGTWEYAWNVTPCDERGKTL